MPMQCGNLFANIPPALSEERVEQLMATGHVRIDRIISRGQTAPASGWYDQPQDEWVALLQGEARIEFQGAPEVSLKAGDWILIHAHQKHRVTFTSTEPACIWLAVHA